MPLPKPKKYKIVIRVALKNDKIIECHHFRYNLLTKSYEYIDSNGSLIDKDDSIPMDVMFKWEI